MEKKYVVQYVMDSSLIVQNYYPVRRGAYAVIPLSTIDTIWHPWTSKTTKVRTGVIIGAVSGFLFGGVYSRVDKRTEFGAPLVGLSAAGLGAIIAGAIPSNDLMLLPDDPEALTFLRTHSRKQSLGGIPVGVLDSLLIR